MTKCSAGCWRPQRTVRNKRLSRRKLRPRFSEPGNAMTEVVADGEVIKVVIIGDESKGLIDISNIERRVEVATVIFDGDMFVSQHSISLRERKC